MEIDARRLQAGFEIPTEAYSDQPYLVECKDGAWLLVVTTGSGHEGEGGQHVVSVRSTDCGKTWSAPVDVEPGDGVEASYAVPLVTPSGRVYVFYNHNTDNLRQVKADNPPFKDGLCSRVDSQGHFVFKYSDDCGLSWSEKRCDVPMRRFEIDLENAYGGDVLFFWNVGKPFTIGQNAYVPIHKVGGFGEGFFTRSEGALLASPNLLIEQDPEKITFETLPEGIIGLRAPQGGGRIAEEQSFVPLSDGSILCNYRTVDGHPAECVSRDGGRSFSPPQYRRYADGRPIKNPRAANFTWKCKNGKYLYWHHMNGGRSYDGRNPVWISGGVEYGAPGERLVRWSQPEILLYDDDPLVRISYPDLIERDGKYFVTETQKDIARVHEIDRAMLEGLWAQFERCEEVERALMVDARPDDGAVEMPDLPKFVTVDRDQLDGRGKATRAGVTIRLDIEADALYDRAVLADTTDEMGRGFLIQSEGGGLISLRFFDGETYGYWRADRLATGDAHRVAFVMDGGPRLVYVVADGALQDGGAERRYGFGRFSPHLRAIDGAALRLGAGVRRIRIHGAALTVSELVGAQRLISM